MEKKWWEPERFAFVQPDHSEYFKYIYCILK